MLSHNVVMRTNSDVDVINFVAQVTNLSIQDVRKFVKTAGDKGPREESGQYLARMIHGCVHLYVQKAINNAQVNIAEAAFQHAVLTIFTRFLAVKEMESSIGPGDFCLIGWQLADDSSEEVTDSYHCVGLHLRFPSMFSRRLEYRLIRAHSMPELERVGQAMSVAGRSKFLFVNLTGSVPVAGLSLQQPASPSSEAGGADSDAELSLGRAKL